MYFLFVDSNELQRHHNSMRAAWTSGGETTLKSLHFHLWQNSRLLGLSTVKLPTTLLLGDFKALTSTDKNDSTHSYFPLVFRSYWEVCTYSSTRAEDWQSLQLTTAECWCGAVILKFWRSHRPVAGCTLCGAWIFESSKSAAGTGIQLRCWGRGHVELEAQGRMQYV